MQLFFPFISLPFLCALSRHNDIHLSWHVFTPPLSSHLVSFFFSLTSSRMTRTVSISSFWTHHFLGSNHMYFFLFPQMFSRVLTLLLFGYIQPYLKLAISSPTNMCTSVVSRSEVLGQFYNPNTTPKRQRESSGLPVRNWTGVALKGVLHQGD